MSQGTPFRTGNPVLSDNTFADFYGASGRAQAMTLDGTVHKTAILLVLVVAAAAWTWHLYMQAVGAAVLPVGKGGAVPEMAEAAAAQLVPWLMTGLIGGVVMALLTIFKRTWAPVTAPLYAICQGLAMGGISAIFESQFPGIVIQAVGLTFGTLGALLLAYRARIIRPTENFKLGVFAATGAIALMYLVNIGLSWFGLGGVPYLHDAGPIGIGISVVIVIVAALNLVLDFDFIERGVESGAPRYMEWFAAFGLLVTLIWLYLEILRLLAKLRSR